MVKKRLNSQAGPRHCAKTSSLTSSMPLLAKNAVRSLPLPPCEDGGERYAFALAGQNIDHVYALQQKQGWCQDKEAMLVALPSLQSSSSAVLVV